MGGRHYEGGTWLCASALVFVFLASATFAQTPASSVTFTSPATGALGTNLQTRDQVSAYAYPDFCSTVDGSTDNTTCLTAALAATGLTFSALEVPAVGTTTVVRGHDDYHGRVRRGCPGKRRSTAVSNSGAGKLICA